MQYKRWIPNSTRLLLTLYKHGDLTAKEIKALYSSNFLGNAYSASISFLRSENLVETKIPRTKGVPAKYGLTPAGVSAVRDVLAYVGDINAFSATMEHATTVFDSQVS